MGKSAKRTDPLRPRASRVEKTRVPRESLPSWYYRVLRLRWVQPPFAYKDPSDFDADLSELEEESEQEEEREQEEDAEQPKEGEEDCECGGEDSECDCRSADDYDSEDEESERLYDGSDAYHYYGLKEEREGRKREKLKEREDKERQFILERGKEEEVRVAYKSLRKAERERTTTPAVSLAGQEFKLFCGDHITHFYDESDHYETKLVGFYQEQPGLDSDDDSDDPEVKKLKPSAEPGMLYGTVSLDAIATCDFGPFRPRSHASWKPVKVRSCDGKWELSFQFIGNGYLKLRVSRDMVFMDSPDATPASPPHDAPEVFDFVGIWRDPEKEKTERERLERERELRRPPSPRESWFELNHPMGYWRSGC
ncbi:hypothetical protein F5883DRAFT_696237 [Diaporthe sp. PMI_573]|nr:hypothetical protein F5883DRAFT_696237 [Diaporthaceae sp. PMI_573]